MPNAELQTSIVVWATALLAPVGLLGERFQPGYDFTGNILKIEWSESRVGNFDVFAKRGQLYSAAGLPNIHSEFSAEKNGIRFPSRLSIEETYINEPGKAFVPLRTDVVYKDFRFFTVEFEVHD